MENKRAHNSGAILLWKGGNSAKDACLPRPRRRQGGFAPIAITAAISVLALAVVMGWQGVEAIKERRNATHFIAESSQNSGSASVSSSRRGNSPAEDIDNTLLPQDFAGPSTGLTANPNDLSKIGNSVATQIAETYSELQQMGAYTPAQGERIASSIASSLSAEVSYTPLTEIDFKTDYDISYKRMLVYRADLQLALQPLLSNSESELEIFGRYIESRDKSNLNKLEEAAKRYKEAAANMRNINVPKDAALYHAAVANSLLEFGATLEAMSKNADDSMATLALLRAYNDAEQNVLLSFNSLALYQKQKAS